MAKTTLLKRAELRQMFHETESCRAPSAYIGYMKTAADAVMDLLDDLDATEKQVLQLERINEGIQTGHKAMANKLEAAEARVKELETACLRSEWARIVTDIDRE